MKIIYNVEEKDRREKVIIVPITPWQQKVHSEIKICKTQNHKYFPRNLEMELSFQEGMFRYLQYKKDYCKVGIWARPAPKAAGDMSLSPFSSPTIGPNICIRKADSFYNLAPMKKGFFLIFSLIFVLFSWWNPIQRHRRAQKCFTFSSGAPHGTLVSPHFRGNWKAYG